MNTYANAPDLGPHEGSWVVTLPSGYVFEIYRRGNADLAVEKGFKVETIGTYLGRINGKQ